MLASTKPRQLVRSLTCVLASIALPVCTAAGESPSDVHQRGKPDIESHEQTAKALRQHIHVLATEIGGRTQDDLPGLRASEAYVTKAWREMGYEVHAQPYLVDDVEVRNLVVEVAGTNKKDEVLVIGAHYDTAFGNPGANDNGSGVAALLEISREFAHKPSQRTIRFVAFVNEEPPYFQTEQMGSVVYAKGCKARNENIVGMLSLETLGYYTDAPKSQHYPALLAPFFPDRGNFLAFVSNGASRSFVKEVRQSFERYTDFPTQSIAAMDAIPGIGWSDHWSFYELGFPSVMVTDTAPNRYQHYHTQDDTEDKLNYLQFARVVIALKRAIADLSR